MIGAPLRLDHQIVGAAVAGFALSTSPDRFPIERFSRRHALSGEKLCSICRALSPVHERQLTMRAELLQVIGEAYCGNRQKPGKWPAVQRIPAGKPDKDELRL